MAAESAPEFLALRDRAHAFVAQHGAVAEAVLLAHVYGGVMPEGLRARLAAPLAGDPRLERTAAGQWVIRRRHSSLQPSSPVHLALTTLVVAATAPNPLRGRVVRVAAARLQAGASLARFTATVNPRQRVPRYVAARLGLETDALDDLPPFAAVLDELAQFLAPGLQGCTIVAQDARLVWALLDAEARRADRILAEPVLVDANELATRVLDLDGKPTLALVAAQLGIGTVRINQPEEEARVLALVVEQLLQREQGPAAMRALLGEPTTQAQGPLLRPSTVTTLPEQPGVYVMRDADQKPLYVGKARRLRARVAAYIGRPLGPTRRLEGLVAAVTDLNPMLCATDLEALVLEDRQIRSLQPRFNTARQQHLPRLWIRLPPPPGARPGKRQLSPRRLQPSFGPTDSPGEFVGPFRNQSVAEQVRGLARSVFDLDALRAADAVAYEAQLELAWAFLHGQAQTAAEVRARRRSPALLRAVLELDVAALLLPADPAHTRYAVLRPVPTGLEGLLIDHAILRGYALASGEDWTRFAAALLEAAEPRTAPEDRAVVLRWFGAQRPPARLVYLPDEPRAAADALEDASASTFASWSNKA